MTGFAGTVVFLIAAFFIITMLIVTVQAVQTKRALWRIETLLSANREKANV
jgi:hypothetical protein